MAKEQVSQIPAAGPDSDVMVQFQDVKMYFPVASGVIFQRKVGDVKAVDGVSLQIRRGETLGLVGESGCGKTTMGRLALLVCRPTSGSVYFDGQDLTKMGRSELRRMRR